MSKDIYELPSEMVFLYKLLHNLSICGEISLKEAL